MRRYLSGWMWVAGIVVFAWALLFTQGTEPAHAAAKVLEKGSTFAVESLPNPVTDTELNVLEAKGTVLTLQGKIPTLNGKQCVFCAKVLTLKPNLSVPFSKKQSFRSGSKGAKLQRIKVKEGGKELNGYMVQEGDGYLLMK
jgi:hypothetical protein